MNRRPRFVTDPARRRLVVWGVGGLLLIVLGVGLAGRVGRRERELHEAEQALLRNDPVAARADLDRYLARRPGDLCGGRSPWRGVDRGNR